MGTETSFQHPGIGREKPHFAVLDGMRGVAAICVVIFHFYLEVLRGYSRLRIGHGFLAVDFFFCLSGFVLGYAYEDRMAEMGLGKFLKVRLIRLQPMVVFGAVLGLLVFYANPFGISPEYGAARMALIFAASVLMIPYGTMQESAYHLFGLNGPSWSLFWEYVANLIFGLFLYRTRRKTLVALTLLAAVALCWTARHPGGLSGGWGVRNFWDGAVRMAFSFCAGLLVYRSGWWRVRWRRRPRIGLGFVSLSLLLMLALVMPYKEGAWVREVVVVVLYFPLLVALGAGAEVSPKMERVCRFSGELSYPLYMTHYSMIWLWSYLARKHSLAFHRFGAATAVGGVLSMVAVAWTTLKLYDEPGRAYLRKRV